MSVQLNARHHLKMRFGRKAVQQRRLYLFNLLSG